MFFTLQQFEQIDRGLKTHTLGFGDAGHCQGSGEVRFSGAKAADEHHSLCCVG